MALSEFEIKRIRRLFASYCHARAPVSLGGRLTIEYRLRGNEVVLYELRPHSQYLDIWYSMAVARFLKGRDGVWRLYSADRNDDWLVYLPCPCHRTIDRLLKVVDEDVTGIFWG